MKKTSSPHVAIIGAGAVGATVCYAITLRNIVAKVTLIDINEKKEAGEIMDIGDGLSLVDTGQVTRGNFSDAKKADIIIVTAGARQKPGETRLALLEKNTSIMRSIFKSIGKIKKTAIILVISNPVDVLTYFIQELSGLPHSQVFGSGTTLDTARLRSSLGSRFQIHPSNVHGYVLGEHGDSEFVAWSSVSIGGTPAKKLPRFSTSSMKKTETAVKREAYNIIEKKGSTHFGIGLVAADIVEAIVYDQQAILPVSGRLTKWNGVSNICLGAPTIIGASGIVSHWPLTLQPNERKKFHASASRIRSYVKHVI